MSYNTEKVTDDLSHSFYRFLKSKNIKNYSILKTNSIKVILIVSITGNYIMMTIYKNKH